MTRPRRPVFDLLLRTFPAPFRRRFGAAMREAYDAGCLDRQGDPMRLLAFRLRTLADLVAAGLRERRRPAGRPRGPEDPSGRWGGMRLSAQDARLGLRMLGKHPALTLVAVFALAVGIPVGLAPTHLANALEAPLPVPEGRRIQLLRYWNPVTSRPEPTTLADLRRWRGVLSTFGALGAARTADYDVATGDALAPPVRGAEVTAAAFDLLRVPPLLGRVLDAADETPGAPLVAVIGFDLWQFRFAGDVRAVGRDMTIAGVPHTIVGVMPRTFRFPANQQLWLPLRNRADAPDDRPLVIVGRLAPGASAAGAQAQLSALGHREASGTADARAALVPEVVPYSYWSALVMGGPRGGIRATPEYYLSQALTLGLLVVACVNVGLLIFARTASRSEELAVRTALGASRARIVTQLFTESLVLAALSAGLGLVLIDRLPALLIGLATRGQMPFWIDLGVGRETVFWTVALAVLSAAVVGIAPALRITGRSVRHHIQHARASRSGRGFGGASGVLIVADVAIAVATVGLAAGLSYQLGQSLDGRAATGVDAARYLAAELRFAASGSREQAAHAERQRALVSRLEAEPGVQGVAVASVLPRMDHPVRTIEADGGAGADPGARHRVRVARVGPGYFEALGRPVISGRAFDAHDFRDGGTAVVGVNAPVVDNVLGGRYPI
ncbi:MAG: ABC transporter permease, partial [Vicinamibacterales bacterium]